jgi:type II secretory pathway pseudopilin PulG
MPRNPLLSRDHTRPVADRTSKPRSAEAGYALIELMVVASLLVIVLGAMLTLGETSQRIAPKETERAQVIREAQVGLHRMTRELRHASQASVGGGSAITAVVPRGTTNLTVRYECNRPHPTDSAYTQCQRFTVSGGNQTGGEVVVDRVLNGNSVFSVPTGSTNYVRALVEVAARGDLRDGHDHRVVLDDGIYMRNVPGP